MALHHVSPLSEHYIAMYGVSPATSSSRACTNATLSAELIIKVKMGHLGNKAFSTQFSSVWGADSLRSDNNSGSQTSTTTSYNNNGAGLRVNSSSGQNSSSSSTSSSSSNSSFSFSSSTSLNASQGRQGPSRASIWGDLRS